MWGVKRHRSRHQIEGSSVPTSLRRNPHSQLSLHHREASLPAKCAASASSPFQITPTAACWIPRPPTRPPLAFSFLPPVPPRPLQRRVGIGVGRYSRRRALIVNQRRGAGEPNLSRAHQPFQPPTAPDEMGHLPGPRQGGGVVSSQPTSPLAPSLDVTHSQRRGGGVPTRPQRARTHATRHVATPADQPTLRLPGISISGPPTHTNR